MLLMFLNSGSQMFYPRVRRHFTPIVGICYVHKTEVLLLMYLKYFSMISAIGEFMYPKVMKKGLV